MSLDPSIRAGDGAAAGAGAATTAAKAGGLDTKRLAQLGVEFESMLLLQMLREMRKSGAWRDEDEEKEGFGAEALLDTVDAELALHLAKGQPFGLGASLVKEIGELSGGKSATTLPLHLPTNLPSVVPASLPLERSASASNSASDSTSDSEFDSTPRSSAEAAVAPVASMTVTAATQPGEHVTTSPFGWRRDPFSGATTYHRGVDLRAAYGESIGAAATGRVVVAGEQGGYGNTVVLEHADGMRTRYAHLSAVLTEVGAEVGAGEAIGRAGHSGRATGTHLHFEVTQHGRPVDPRTLSEGRLKPERVVADWAVGAGTSHPEVPMHEHTGRRR